MEKNSRSQHLLDIIQKGVLTYTADSIEKQLGDRSKYIGLSDIGSYIGCPRNAVLNKLSTEKEKDFSSVLTLSRGHWFEDGIANALQSLQLPFIRQLEIAIEFEGVRIKAHLDFVLIAINPNPVVRILEVKSCSKLPDELYSSYEIQTYGQVSMLYNYWNNPVFSLTDISGKTLLSHCTFPQICKKIWNVDIPDSPVGIDIEAWVLALSMTDAKVFGAYTYNEHFLHWILDNSISFNKFLSEENNQGLPTATGFYPICEYCRHNSDCPKFRGIEHPELAEGIAELMSWKEQKQDLDDKIKERENAMKEIYAKIDSQGWITAGNKRFKVAPLSGRKSYDMDGIENELQDIFDGYGVEDNVQALFSRHQKVSAPSSRLTINTIN